MVKGLDVFRDYFADYTGHYVLIGGTAATLTMEDAGLDFRATKDLDIVLYVEDVLNADFGRRFWQFIEEGEYEMRQKSEGNPRFYRFQKPAKKGFPAMLELFSRIPDGLNQVDGARFTLIPLDEAVSSLSAILMDKDYYDFVMQGRKLANDLAWIEADRLIPLKAIAWLDLTDRKNNGEKVDSKNIRKHRNDILQLAQLLVPTSPIILSEKIAQDLRNFLDILKEEHEIDLKSLGIRNLTLPEVVRRIADAFSL